MQKLILKGGLISLVLLLNACTEQEKPATQTATQTKIQPTQPERTHAMSALNTPPEAIQPPTLQTAPPPQTTETKPATVVTEEEEKEEKEEQEPECE